MDIIHSLRHFKRDCGRELITPKSISVVKENSPFYKKIKNPTRSYNVIFRDLLWKIPVWKGGGVLEWAQKISPDVIFVYLGGGRYMLDVVLFLSKHLHIPYMVFYGDDYVLYAPKKRLFDRLQYWRSKRYYSTAINGALRCFCIGDLMAIEYSSFFGKAFYPIMNSVATKEFIPSQSNGDNIVMSYLGGLHLNRWKMLRRLADHLPDNTIIQIYTGTPLTIEMEEALSHPRIVLHGLVPQEEVERIMIESDILLHVESDEEEYRNYTHLSVSTKIPEYMMAGRLIVAYGPTEVASMKLISSNRLGIVISSDCNDIELKNQLSAICSNPDMFNGFGTAAYQYANSVFNREKVASEFRKEVEKALDESIKIGQ